MTLVLPTEYPGRAGPVSPSRPQGSFKNETSPGVSDDGTPLDSAFADDFLGSVSAILKAAGITASGLADTADVSDFKDAMFALFLRTGAHTLAFPAASMTPSDTDGAELATLVTAVNGRTMRVFLYDAGVEESTEWDAPLPKSVNATSPELKGFVWWSHGATAGNFDVTFGLSAIVNADGVDLDVAYGTEVTVTDTGGVTDRSYFTPISIAIPLVGLVKGGVASLKLARKVGGGTDLAIDARVHGFITTVDLEDGNDA